MRKVWDAIQFGAITAGRFAVRMACDEKGDPSTARVLVWPWSLFAAAFYWRAVGVEKAAPVALETVVSVTFVTLAIILWSAAVKLGLGVFVPFAEAIGGIVSRVGTGLRGMVASYTGPDRTVGVMDPGGELYRGPPDPPEPVIKSDVEQEP